MPQRTIIYGIAILSLLIILGGYVGWSLVNSKMSPESASPNPNASPNAGVSPGGPSGGSSTGDNFAGTSPAPDTSPVEQVRDAVMNYIQVNHPETASLIANFAWTGGSQPTYTPSSESYIYNSSGWGVAIQFSVSPNPTYYITASYNSGMILWEGSYQDGVIAQIIYNYSSNLTTALSNQEQARDAVMSYIQSKHPMTAQFMGSFDWSGQAESTGSSGSVKYDYYSGGWIVTVQYPLNVIDPTYLVTANFVGQANVDWQGTYQTGTIVETSYSDSFPTPTIAPTQTPTAIPTSTPIQTSTPPASTSSPTPKPPSTPTPTPSRTPTPTPTLPPITPDQVRTTAMNYIRINHPEMIPFTPTGTWSRTQSNATSTVYTNAGWKVTLVNIAASIPSYNLTVSYVAVSQHPSMNWTGTYNAIQGIAELGYSYEP